MTLKEIEAWIEKIKGLERDCEDAHLEEVSLYTAFVQYVANGGTKDLKAKAKLVLTTEDLEFPRYYS